VSTVQCQVKDNYSFFCIPTLATHYCFVVWHLSLVSQHPVPDTLLTDHRLLITLITDN